MKQYDTSTCTIPLKFNGPDTVEAYDQAGGKVGICLEDAISGTIAWSTLPEFHEQFLPKVKEFTGVERAVNEAQTEKARSRSKTPDKVKDVMEYPTVYIRRAMAKLDDEKKKEFFALAQSVADTINIDPAPSKRQAGPDKNLLAKADSLLTLPTDALEAKVSTLLTEVDGFDLTREDDGKPERTSLARLVGAVLDARLATI